MFHDRTNSLDLQNSLEKFITNWFGTPLPWYGVDAAKLERADLPSPLAWLYSFAGYWPSNNWHEHLFGADDGISPFECLMKSDGKLIFGSESQGQWTVSTLDHGENPPVWISTDTTPDWTPLCDSLMEFLVTFCLRESMFASAQTGAGYNLIECFRSNGNQVTPLWLGGPYIGLKRLEDDCEFQADKLDFYLIDSWILATDNSCGWRGGQFASTSSPKIDFVQWNEPVQEFRRPFSNFESIPDDIAGRMPKTIFNHHYENLIKRHKEQSTYHDNMVEKYTAIPPQ